MSCLPVLEKMNTHRFAKHNMDNYVENILAEVSDLFFYLPLSTIKNFQKLLTFNHLLSWILVEFNIKKAVGEQKWSSTDFEQGVSRL